MRRSAPQLVNPGVKSSMKLSANLPNQDQHYSGAIFMEDQVELGWQDQFESRWEVTKVLSLWVPEDGEGVLRKKGRMMVNITAIATMARKIRTKKMNERVAAMEVEEVEVVLCAGRSQGKSAVL
jgi:hypothetical protein